MSTEIILPWLFRVATRWFFFCQVRVGFVADRNYFVMFGSVYGCMDIFAGSVSGFDFSLAKRLHMGFPGAGGIGMSREVILSGSGRVDFQWTSQIRFGLHRNENNFVEFESG